MRKKDIKLGLPHKAADYKGNELAGLWTPLRYNRSGYFDVRTPQGGICHMKAKDFIRAGWAGE